MSWDNVTKFENLTGQLTEGMRIIENALFDINNGDYDFDLTQEQEQALFLLSYQLDQMYLSRDDLTNND